MTSSDHSSVEKRVFGTMCAFLFGSKYEIRCMCTDCESATRCALQDGPSSGAIEISVLIGFGREMRIVPPGVTCLADPSQLSTGE